MTRLRDTELLPLNFKIEKTYQRNQKTHSQLTSLHNIMANSRKERADTKALHDYATPTIMDTISKIKNHRC